MAGGLSVRKEVSNLQPQELDALRDGYARMMAISGDDNRSWIYWASQHGFQNWYCWHYDRPGLGQRTPFSLFLPWHRAYLLYFDHSVRDQNEQAILPWWDWTSTLSHSAGVPASYATPSVSGGSANPLYSGPMPSIQGASARQTIRFPGDPSQLPTDAQVQGLMTLGDFVDFSNQLEDIHDGVHGWTGGTNPANPNQGGDMGNVGLAAYDPIFWAHHCMIDRIWYLWQLRNGNNSVPQNYLNQALAPFGVTVASVLDIQTLGYQYAGSEVST